AQRARTAELASVPPEGAPAGPGEAPAGGRPEGTVGHPGGRPEGKAGGPGGRPGRQAPTDLLERKLLFVTGKGGVGKTTVATSLALLAANRGKRTLLCEIDAKGAIADALETGHTGFQPAEVHPRLWAMSMDTEASLREYLRLFLRVPV